MMVRVNNGRNNYNKYYMFNINNIINYRNNKEVEIWMKKH